RPRARAGSLLAQHVPHAADGVDQAPLALALQLAPQVADVDVDDVAAARVLGPDLLLDLEAVEDLAWVAGEELEQLELLGRELDAPPVAEHLAALEVDHQVGHPHLAGDGRVHAPEVRADAGQQLLDAEGLDEVVVRARVEARDLVLDRVLGGEDDDGRVGGLADAPGDLEAVQDGKHQVEHDEVRVQLPELRETGDAVVAHDRVVVLGLELQVDELRDLLLVLDDEDQWFPLHAGILARV